MERNEVYILPATTATDTTATNTITTSTVDTTPTTNTADTTTTTGTTSDYATNTTTTPTPTSNAYTTTTTTTGAEQQQGYFLVGAQLPYIIQLFKKAFPTITAVNTSTAAVILHRKTERRGGSKSAATGSGVRNNYDFINTNDTDEWKEEHSSSSSSRSVSNVSIINVAKLLFQHLIHDRTAWHIHIHTWWVRSICITIAARERELLLLQIV